MITDSPEPRVWNKLSALALRWGPTLERGRGAGRAVGPPSYVLTTALHVGLSQTPGILVALGISPLPHPAPPSTSLSSLGGGTSKGGLKEQQSADLDLKALGSDPSSVLQFLMCNIRVLPAGVENIGNTGLQKVVSGTSNLLIRAPV